MAKSHDKRVQKADEPERALERKLAEHYTRISQAQEIDPKILAAVKICLERIPGRIPTTPATRRVITELMTRLIRVIAVRTPDVHGTPREIDQVIAELSGEQELGARRLYLALIALNGRTALVQRPSRSRWILLLNKVTDQRAEEHLQLLQETPSYGLQIAPVAPRAQRRTTPAPAPEPPERSEPPRRPR